MKKPQIKQDPMYQLIRDGNVAEFNKQKAAGVKCDLTHCDFRGLDLQGIDVIGLDLTGAYFRLSDLRGVDFSKTRMDGVSIHEAKISGTYFPKDLSAEEITLSLVRGTRMRTGC